MSLQVKIIGSTEALSGVSIRFQIIGVLNSVAFRRRRRLLLVVNEHEP